MLFNSRVRLGLVLKLGLDVMSGLLVVMQMYLYYYPLSLSLSRLRHSLCNCEDDTAFNRRRKDRTVLTILF